jgi:hypothetical protein
MRGRNQYNYIYCVLFGISFSRGSSGYMDVGGDPGDFRGILDRRS